MLSALRIGACFALLAALLAGCGSGGGQQAASSPPPDATGPGIPQNPQIDPKPLALQLGDLGDPKWQAAKGSRYLSRRLLEAQDPQWLAFLDRHGRQLSYRVIYERQSRIAQCVIGAYGSLADAKAVEAEVIPFTLVARSAGQLGTVRLVDRLGPDGGHAAQYESTTRAGTTRQTAIASWRRGVLAISCVEAMKVDAPASIPRVVKIATAQDLRIVSELPAQ